MFNGSLPHAMIVGLLAASITVSAGAAASKSSSNRTSASTSKTAAAQKGMYGPAASPQNRAGAGQSKRAARRTLIPPTGPQPSPKVAQIIRERQMSAGGVLGAAFLVAMLSRSDLSSNDRQWIQSRIAAMREGSGSDDEGLIPAVSQSVIFTFLGIEQGAPTGQTAHIKASARTGQGNSLPIACEFPPAPMKNQHESSTVEWMAPQEGAYLLTCRAGGITERRLVRIVDAKSS